MTPYRSTSGKKSGVTAYEISETHIAVQFRDKDTYLYTYESAGASVVERMKMFALRSSGLSTFIAENKPKHLQKY